MAITQWVNFDNSPLDGGYEYTLGSTELPEDDVLTTAQSASSLTDNGGGDYSLKLDHWSVEYRAPSSDVIAPADGFRAFVEVELPTVANNVRVFDLDSASGNWSCTVQPRSGTVVRAVLQNGSFAIECDMPFYPTDATPFCIELRWDPSESTAEDRLQGRAWNSGDTVPSLQTGGNVWATPAGGTADWDYCTLGDGGNGGNHEYFKLIFDDDPDVDLSGYEDTDDYPGGGGGATVTGTDLVQVQAIDAPTISQHHQLTGTDLVQLQVIDAASVSVTGVLTAEELVQLQALDIPAISQDHQLTAAELVQLQVLDAGAVTQSAVLTALELVQVQSIDAAVIVVAGVLTAEQLVQIQAFDAVVLTQDHQLTAEELVQLQVIAGAGVSIPTDYIPRGRAIIVAHRSRAVQIAKRLRAMRVSR